MDQPFFIVIVCLFWINNSSIIPYFNSHPVEMKVTQISEELSPEQLYQLAKSITVKVLVEDTWGSGTLIDKQGDIYTVITNRHVLQHGENYQIQTADSLIHEANLSKISDFEDQDLGILTFRSPDSVYQIASFGDSSQLNFYDHVFASGFPIQPKLSDTDGFLFTSGEISFLLTEKLLGGYEIGYTNEISKGMSGGSILNRQGKLIGINGWHSYPLWGDPYIYIFQDGSIPSVIIREAMSQSSWGISINTIINFTTN